jgi:uncharacterized protein (DUF1919 family)
MFKSADISNDEYLTSLLRIDYLFTSIMLQNRGGTQFSSSKNISCAKGVQGIQIALNFNHLSQINNANTPQ